MRELCSNGLSKNSPGNYWLTDRIPNQTWTFSEVWNFWTWSYTSNGDVIVATLYSGIYPHCVIFNITTYGESDESPSKSCVKHSASRNLVFNECDAITKLLIYVSCIAFLWHLFTVSDGDQKPKPMYHDIIDRWRFIFNYLCCLPFSEQNGQPWGWRQSTENTGYRHPLKGGVNFEGWVDFRAS